MAYVKTDWRPRVATGKTRFLKSQETSTEVYLDNEPLTVTDPGTPFSEGNMNHIEQGIFDAHEAIAAETQERIQGDVDTLQSAKDYTDQRFLGTNEFLAPVKTTAQLPTIGLDNTKNYLCKVVADPVQSGVYQAVAGWTGQPVWALYDDTVDFVEETELAAAVAAEAQVRELADQALQDQIDTLVPEGLENLPAQIAEKADKNAILTDEAASDTLPATVSTLLTALLQTMRNNLKHLFANKANKNHASTTTDYGIASGATYGHVRYPTAGTTTTIPQAAFPYYYMGASTTVNLNDYRTAGIWTFYNPSSSSTNFPAGFGTGTSNSAILEVWPFYSDTAGIQSLRKRGTKQRWERYYTAAGTFSAWELVSGTQVGDVYIRYPGMKSPSERNFDGNWTKWNARAIFYGLSVDLPIASGTVATAAGTAAKTVTVSGFTYAQSDGKILNITFTNANTAAAPTLNVSSQGARPIWYNGAVTSSSNMLPYNSNVQLEYDHTNSRFVVIGALSSNVPAYNPSASVPISKNAYRVFTHADQDVEIFQAIEEIPLTNGVIGPFSPVKWRRMIDSSTANFVPTFVLRSDVQSSWTVSDLAIGATVTYGGATRYITARHTPGGKYVSFDGGNRPTFISGGVQPDVLRNFNGTIGRVVGSEASGVFYFTSSSIWLSGGSAYGTSMVDIDPSRAVPTGPENGGRTFGTEYWIRVS